MHADQRPVGALVLAASLSLALAACGPSRTPDATTPDGAASDATPVEDPEGFDEVTLPDHGVSPAPTPTRDDATTARPTPRATTTASAAPVDPYPVLLAWDGIELRLPSARTELVGLHQSNHDGARDVEQVGDAVPVVVLDSRERGTGRRGASDIVVHPDTELRAPVSGTVVRAGTYTLYCDQLDDFVVIEPTGRPGIEVKLLHVDGVQVAAGDEVVAGVTVLAPRPTQLPFASQVDEVSGPDDWPHVHLEVVDTSIPDRPNENSGSDDC